MSATRPRHYEFGAFQLDAAEYRLLRNGEKVPLPPKAFDLLVVLIERSGHVLGKDELLEAVWPDTIVDESNLTFTISLLRKALEESAEQKFIETIPKRGYRFVASVTPGRIEDKTLVLHERSRTRLVVEEEEEIENGGSSIEDRELKIENSAVVRPSGYTHSADAVPATVLSRRFSILNPLPSIIGLIALVVVATLGVAYLLREPTEARAVRSLIPLPEKPNLFPNSFGFDPALSPDGTRMVFVARTEDRPRQLWVHTLSTMSAEPLVGTEGVPMYSYPFWSPDGRYIAFSWNKRLMKVPASGGPVTALCDIDGPMRGGTWSGDGVIVFAPGTAGPLYQVSANGGIPEAVTILEEARGVFSHRFPYFLPDGRHFLYVGRCHSYDESVEDFIYVASLDSKEKRSLVQSSYGAAYADGYLLFMKQGNLMAQAFDMSRQETSGEEVLLAERVYHGVGTGRARFSVSQNGLLAYRGESQQLWQLTWTDRSGNAVRTLGEPIPLRSGPSISPDGQRVIVSIEDEKTRNLDLWIFEVARGIRTRFTSHPANEGTPVWSPDGSRIAFVSTRNGRTGIYVKTSSGVGDEELLFESDSRKGISSWSPDGRFILFRYWDHKTRWDLGILPVLENEGPGIRVGEVSPFWQTEVSTGGIAQFSPDGRWIVYASDETGQREVYVAPFPGPGERRRISPAGGAWSRWRGDGKEIIYGVQGGRKLMAAEVDTSDGTLQVGEVRPLFDTRSYDDTLHYDVSPDGQRFLVGTAVGPTGPPQITLVTNWTADLKR